MEKNLKVLEAAYNLTDAVIESKSYFIVRGYGDGIYHIKASLSEEENSEAHLAIVYRKSVNDFDFWEIIPVRDNVRNIILQEVQKFHEEEVRKAREEEQLKAEFEEWRANNGR